MLTPWKILVTGTSAVLVAVLPQAPAHAVPNGVVGGAPCVQWVGHSDGVSVSLVDEGGMSYCVVEFRATGDNSWTVPSGVESIDYLVVAGGGGGGRGWNGTSAGAGGAGGLLFGSNGVDSCTTLIVTVGAGGVAGTVDVSDDGSTQLVTPEPGGNGGNSVLGSIEAIGGGGGGNSRAIGIAGGSGGGAGGRTASNTNIRTGGIGTIGQGFDGGESVGVTFFGGGGGGATGPGSDAASGGAGGTGFSSAITGTDITYASGGDGGTYATAGGVSGEANTGDGGGASSTLDIAEGPPGGTGGSGIVVVRYAADTGVDVAECRLSLFLDIDISHYLESNEALPDTGNQLTVSLLFLAMSALVSGSVLMFRYQRRISCEES